MDKKVFVIHENDDWTQHLTKRLEQVGVPFESWHLDKGHFDLAALPPDGVFYNRMSASSHTRGHRYAPELTGAVLDWLELNDRKVLNGSRALQFELSKVKQYAALERAGVKTPKTVFAVGKDKIIDAAKELDVTPFITKHNRAGKGLGVRLFDNVEALADYVNGPDFDDSVDGITLIQEYIKSPGGFITRAEFVGGKYLYSVRVLTDDGFQLCPADNCVVEFSACPAGYEDELARGLSVPVFTGAAAIQVDDSLMSGPVSDLAEPMKFEIIADAQTIQGKYRELTEKLERFLAENKIAVAGIEFIEDAEGNLYTYDVNTNTNYNKDAETKADKYAMLELAKLLDSELQQIG